MAEDRSVFSRTAAGPTNLTSYGPHPDQVIDVWLPSTAIQVTVVLIHGGFWDQEYDRGHCRPLAAALADQGIQVLLPEYRRVRGDGGWPRTFDDVRMVSDHVSASKELGDRVVLVGHSAGGQLALWLAAVHQPVGLSAVLALAPICDLAGAHALGLGDDAVARLMGGSPATVPERYAAVNPRELPDPLVPVTIIHGSNDSLVPVTMSRDHVTVQRTARLLEQPCGHFELIDPLSRQFELVLSEIRGA